MIRDQNKFVTKCIKYAIFEGWKTGTEYLFNLMHIQIKHCLIICINWISIALSKKKLFFS